MAVYFTIYTFSDFPFIPRKFCSTRASTTKNEIFGVLTPDPLIYTNIISQLVPKTWQNYSGHYSYVRPTSILRLSLHHNQIRNNSFHQKRTSLRMRCRRNHHPIVSLWASIHHCIIPNSRKEGVTGEGFRCECGASGTALKSSV